MSHEVAQWLAEIKALKQQVAQLESDRTEALESADKWRQLYNTEAQQRRTEAKLAQQTIVQLQSQLQQMSRPDLPSPQHDEAQSQANAQLEAAQLENPEALRAKLMEVMIERDRLVQALKAEQLNHIQTRKNLTTVIGDTLDRLSRERESRSREGSAPPQASSQPAATALDLPDFLDSLDQQVPPETAL